MKKTKGEALPLKDHQVKVFEPPAGKMEAMLFDASTNLVLRANRSTKDPSKITRHWLHRHYVDGKRRYAPLGTYDDMSVKAAREASKNWAPAAVVSPAPLVAPATGFAAMTFGEVIDAYLQKKRKPSTTKTFTDVANIYLADEALRARPAASIEPLDAWKIIEVALTQRMVRDKNKKIVAAVQKEEFTPGIAEKLHALCSAAFSDAMFFDKSNLINPFKRVRKYSEFETEITKRAVDEERALTLSEIPIVWKNLNKPHGYGVPAVARALMLMLVTGQRPSEVLTMHRREILPPDRNGDIIWCIPPEKIKTCKITDRKNWRPHLVPLTPLALRIIGNYKGNIFEGASDTETVALRSLNHLINRERDQEQDGVKSMFIGAYESWSPNDLRRTVQTTLEVHLDCPERYTAAILNHDKRSKIQKSYTVHNDYPAEKRKWLRRWSAWLIVTIGRKHTRNIRHTDPPKYDIERLRELAAAGISNRAIAEEFGNISETRVRQLRIEHGIKSKKQREAVEADCPKYRTFEQS